MFVIEEGIIIFGCIGVDYLVVSCDLKIEVEGIVFVFIIMILFNDVVGDEVGVG